MCSSNGSKLLHPPAYLRHAISLEESWPRRCQEGQACDKVCQIEKMADDDIKSNAESIKLGKSAGQRTIEKAESLRKKRLVEVTEFMKSKEKRTVPYDGVKKSAVRMKTAKSAGQRTTETAECLWSRKCAKGTQSMKSIKQHIAPLVLYPLASERTSLRGGRSSRRRMRKAQQQRRTGRLPWAGRSAIVNADSINSAKQQDVPLVCDSLVCERSFLKGGRSSRGRKRNRERHRKEVCLPRDVSQTTAQMSWSL